jgi:hypothetical protein
MKQISKFWLVAIGLAFFFSTACTGSPVAEASPESTVKSMVSDIKKEKSSAAVLKYIHWPSAFESTSTEDRKMMNINTPEDLKQYASKMMKDPAKAMREHMESSLEGMPESQKDMARETMSGMIAMMEEGQKEAAAELERTSFKVGDSKIDGDEAVVDLFITVDGETKKEEVNLKKIDGSWYMNDLAFGADDNEEF